MASSANDQRAAEQREPATRRATQSVRRNVHWWLLGSIALLGLIAVIGGAWRAHVTRDKWSDSLWLEVAKAGVGVVAVGVLGGALANLWKGISARRTSEDERNEKIRAELASLVSLYNEVKAIRRTLRSLGLDLGKYPAAEREAAREGAVLTEEQACGFHAQMLVLNGLQLGFEAKAKQFGQTNFLDEDTEGVVTLIGVVEEHLNQVLELWEQRGWTIREGTALAVVYEGLTKLFRVREHFGPNVAEPLHEVTRLINKHVFGEALPETKDALQVIDEKHDQRDDGQDESG